MASVCCAVDRSCRSNHFVLIHPKTSRRREVSQAVAGLVTPQFVGSLNEALATTGRTTCGFDAKTAAAGAKLRPALRISTIGNLARSIADLARRSTTAVAAVASPLGLRCLAFAGCAPFHACLSFYLLLTSEHTRPFLSPLQSSDVFGQFVFDLKRGRSSHVLTN